MSAGPDPPQLPEVTVNWHENVTLEILPCMFPRSLRHGTQHRLEVLFDYQWPSLLLTHALRCQLQFALQSPQHTLSLFAHR